MKVEKIIDGDTVYATLEGKPYKLRLTEIDAPERDQPFGRQSKVFLRELLKDGEFDGLWINWYKNGKKKVEKHYKDGKEDGLWTEWDEDGKKTFQGNFVNGNEQ